MDSDTLGPNAVSGRLNDRFSLLAPATPYRRRVILIAESDGMVRTSIAGLLDAGHYKTLAASTGFEAVRIAASHRGRISLLMTELKLPDFLGWELADVIQLDHPGLRVLYMAPTAGADQYCREHAEPELILIGHSFRFVVACCSTGVDSKQAATALDNFSRARLPYTMVTMPRHPKAMTLEAMKLWSFVDSWCK
jgi:CheY-like chemotaxis protein